MKKKALLLFSLLFTYFSISAATPYTICEDGEQVLTATKVGKSYQWFLDDVKIEGATQNTYTAKEAGKYTCEITQEGTNTTNQVPSGNFDYNFDDKRKGKRYTEPIYDPILDENYTIEYNLPDFNTQGNANPGECTTARNPQDIKKEWFSSIPPKKGTHLLACDGKDGEWLIWSASKMRLKKGQKYQFSCWGANIDKKYFDKDPKKRAIPEIAFYIKDKKGTRPLGPYMKLPVTEKEKQQNRREWKEFYVQFTAEYDDQDVTIFIKNKTVGSEGNDFALDEVYFGSAPDQVVNEEFEVKVDKIPTVELTQPAPECEGVEIQLNATITGATEAQATLVWKKNDEVLAGRTTATIDITVPEADKTDTYQLSVTNGKCKAVTAETTVTGKSCGNPPIIHLVQNVCLGASYVLEAETKDADQYLWENGDTGKQVTWVAENIGDLTYKCTVTLENGTTVEEIFPVHVELCSDVQEFFETICQGEEYIFHEEVYTLPGDYEYKYTTPEGIKMTEILHLSVNEPSIVEFTDSICQGEAYQDYGFSFTSAETQNPGSYDFMNNGINVGGCDSTTILHLDIFPLPVFETKVNIQTMEVQVSVGAEPFLYTLDDSQGFTTNYFEKLTVGKHTIQVTDAHQCSSSQEFEIESIPLKPNVYFSPNGDGNHDVWYIEGIEFYPNAIIQIYDRNNKQIAHFLVPDFKGWDGQYNGHGMPADDYWYLLTVPELGKQYSGHFTLKR